MNFFIRKMAGFAKPENIIKVEDDGTIVIATNSTFIKNEQRFKLNESFEEINHFTKKNFKVLSLYSTSLSLPLSLSLVVIKCALFQFLLLSQLIDYDLQKIIKLPNFPKRHMLFQSSFQSCTSIG